MGGGTQSKTTALASACGLACDGAYKRLSIALYSYINERLTERWNYDSNNGNLNVKYWI